MRHPQGVGVLTPKPPTSIAQKGVSAHERKEKRGGHWPPWLLALACSPCTGTKSTILQREDADVSIARSAAGHEHAAVPDGKVSFGPGRDGAGAPERPTKNPADAGGARGAAGPVGDTVGAAGQCQSGDG